MFRLYPNPFFDRSIVLTRATEGLGPALARALIARGAKPVALDPDRRALDRLAEDLGGGIVTLARNLAEPTAPIEIARWLADEHRDIGGFVCNAAGGRPEAMSGDVFAPLATFGFLGSLLPERRHLKLALLLPGVPLGQDILRISDLTRGFSGFGGRSFLTTALLTGRVDAESAHTRARAADLILEALARGRATVRVRARAALPTGPGKTTLAETQGGKTCLTP